MELSNSNIKLSIGILVSNSINTIKRCMDSLKPVLKEISSELIIVDTGGTDGAIDVCRDYTDKIYPFMWCNDFAAARNECLKHASGEWFMFLDDDEWLLSTEELVGFFLTGEYKQYSSAMITVRNYNDPQFQTYGDTNLVRLYKRYEGIAFAGRIHEHISLQDDSVKMLDTVAGHSGYIYVTQEDRLKKFERNVPLILKELESDSENLHLLMQLAQEYMVALKYQDMIDFYETHHDVLKKYEKTAFVNFILYAAAKAYGTYYDAGTALEHICRLEQNYSLNEMATLAISYIKLILSDEINDCRICFDEAERYKKAYAVLIADEKKRCFQSISSMAFFMSQDKLSEVEEIQKNAAAKKELLELKAALKENINLLIANGKQQEAEVMINEARKLGIDI